MASLDVAAMPAWMPASDLESAASFDVYTAASFGDVSRLRDLLNTRRDADAQNRGGWTPLMYAACSGQRAILQLLLEQGASVNLHGGRHKRTATIVAAMYGRQQCIALLHQHGADLELRDHEDRTALFHAAALGHAAVVQLLVDLGASINCVERFSGHSPLSIATDQNHDNVVEILLNAGSRFSQPATNGNTLHPARQNNIPKTSPCGRARCPEVESLVRRCANLAVEGTSPRPSLNLPPKSAVRDLADFLSHFGLSKYVPMLEAQGIDLDQFLAFGEAQLEQAGIRLVGPKRKMAIAISCWNERERQQAEHKGTVQKALR
ncbi:B-cell lymphoma 3 protein homolog isoform X1 [Dermacentor andersoni]|uniref:B-cell lymphoma 3 protein homolog isoform X1 n=1 Tax=Dermacentor andersoni TaxID=34620 RepID=UPI00241768CB|nr:ankyrin repeat and SAM domain-containing protein 3-like isoform X1 [Dermacentor andersoni]